VKTIGMSFDTWLNRHVLKPQNIFKGLDIKYQHEQNFWVYIGWDIHIKHLSSKLNRGYYLMQSLKGETSVNIIRNTYFADFHSYLRYGILFWGGDGDSKINFNIQRKL
jgi:hypothetical protein